MFIGVATFGAQADACANYLVKGRAIAADSSIARGKRWRAPAAPATKSSAVSSSASASTAAAGQATDGHQADAGF